MSRRARPPSKTALFEAAKVWDFAAVKAIVAVAPGLLTATDPKGRAALHIACAVRPGGAGLGEASGIRTVTALLEAGADLEAEVPMDEDEEDFRATPVWYAVSRGENPPLVRFLLKRGADASYSLWASVWRDDAVLCRDLLKAKPRLNLKAHGETPIFYAARLQRLKTLDLLIEAGADPTIADRRGRDAVDIARARRLPKELIARLEDLKKTHDRAGEAEVGETACACSSKPMPRCVITCSTLGSARSAWPGASTGCRGCSCPSSSRGATERRLRGRSAIASPGEPPAPIRRAVAAIESYLGGERVDFSPVVLDLTGVSDFHRQIYEKARGVGWGETTTYGALARQAGFPDAARAVGQAMGRNPIPIIIPCHRVLASGGKVGGFSAFGGADTKQRLLALEGVALDEPMLPGLLEKGR